jgi:hypothetical protein
MFHFRVREYVNFLLVSNLGNQEGSCEESGGF